MNNLPASIILFIFFYLSASGFCMAQATEFSVVTQNLKRLFDDRDDGNQEKVVSTEKYRKRLDRLVRKISTELVFPDILAVQEVENIRILDDARELLSKRHAVHYRPILLEGNDVSGIDVGFLVKKSLPVKSVTALFADLDYGSENKKLFARPPLLIEICIPKCINILNLHLRSMRGLRSAREGQRVALKRRLQAETVAHWVDKIQQQSPQQMLIVAGDFNALTPSDKYVDSVGIIRGNPDQQRPKWKSRDLVTRDLTDVTREVNSGKRYSYIYKRKKQQLDYILVSENLINSIQSVSFSRIDYKFSDHAAVIVRLRLEPSTKGN